ncbi:hypothetical protein GCM10007067_06090 [Lysobacter bugurensis]|uniref:Uncharacterized protein n=1 Tax=Cognatilysobacter bugurensis TaxID=543356 RepID=A0A918SUQ7_9GAMM|nr:hypothetical protein GCM10007067_06090 [Lysobacter bugurensis]
MSKQGQGSGDGWLKWAYGFVFILMAIGAGRSLLKLARTWGWA